MARFTENKVAVFLSYVLETHLSLFQFLYSDIIVHQKSELLLECQIGQKSLIKHIHSVGHPVSCLVALYLNLCDAYDKDCGVQRTEWSVLGSKGVKVKGQQIWQVLKLAASLLC